MTTALPINNDGLYDYVGVEYPTSSSEKYTFRLGGSTGALVSTLLVTYTDATKANISSVQSL